jgi:hypothetical protein
MEYIPLLLHLYSLQANYSNFVSSLRCSAKNLDLAGEARDHEMKPRNGIVTYCMF